jgi:type IV secretion system protein VirB10
MTLSFWRRRSYASQDTAIDRAPSDEGERRPPADRQSIPTASTPSVTARIHRVLGVGFLSLLGLGFLSWYYAHALARPLAGSARASANAAGQGESALPPLGPIAPHRFNPPMTAKPAYAIGSVLIDDPESPADPDLAAIDRATATNAYPSHASAPPTPDRRLTGSVFARAAGAAAPAPVTAEPDSVAESGAAQNVTPPALATRLAPTLTPAVAAGILPTQRLLLPKGAFIDCTLETAIDSTLPGLTTCLTALDTFSADGKVVLLERGTKLIGETQGQVQQGASRLFVLWNEARTPNGVVVNLASPGTDELGRAGLAGQVNRHFFDRFGAAILVSVIDGAIQSAAQNSRGNGASVVYNPDGTRDVLTEILRSTVNIPPTVTVKQGARIQILVARDLDFRTVYALHAR